MYIGRLVPCLFNCLVDLAPYPDISSARNFLLNFFLSCDNRKICKERKKMLFMANFFSGHCCTFLEEGELHKKKSHAIKFAKEN